jgi:hypothetical protein
MRAGFAQRFPAGSLFFAEGHPVTIGDGDGLPYLERPQKVEAVYDLTSGNGLPDQAAACTKLWLWIHGSKSGDSMGRAKK